jgi:hypothetical protein
MLKLNVSIESTWEHTNSSCIMNIHIHVTTPLTVIDVLCSCSWSQFLAIIRGHHDNSCSNSPHVFPHNYSFTTHRFLWIGTRFRDSKYVNVLSVRLSHLIYTLANVAALSLRQARLITNGGHMHSVREVTVPSTVHGWNGSDAWHWAGLVLARGMHWAIVTVCKCEGQCCWRRCDSISCVHLVMSLWVAI